MLPETKNLFPCEIEKLNFAAEDSIFTDSRIIVVGEIHLIMDDVPQEQSSPQLLINKDKNFCEEICESDRLNRPHDCQLEYPDSVNENRLESVLEDYNTKKFNIEFDDVCRFDLKNRKDSSTDILDSKISLFEKCKKDSRSNEPSATGSKEEMKEMSDFSPGLPWDMNFDINLIEFVAENQSKNKLTYLWPQNQSMITRYIWDGSLAVDFAENLIRKIIQMKGEEFQGPLLKVSCSLTQDFSFSLQVIDSSMRKKEWPTARNVADSEIFHNLPKLILESFLRKRYLATQAISEHTKSTLISIASETGDSGKFSPTERETIDAEYPEIIEYFEERVESSLILYYKKAHKRIVKGISNFAKTLKNLPEKIEKFPKKFSNRGETTI